MESEKATSSTASQILARQRTALIFQLLNRIVWAIGWAIIVAATWFPLQQIQIIAGDLAGKQTALTLSLTATLSISAIFGGTALTYWFKNRRQKSELERTRQRLELKEATIDRMEAIIARLDPAEYRRLKKKK